MLELRSPMARRFHVWKAVHRDRNGTLGSLIITSGSNCYTYYTPKEYVKPKIGKIFAFSDLSSTEKFTMMFDQYQIWECLTTKKPIVCRHSNLLNYMLVERDSILQEYWEDFFPSPARYNGTRKGNFDMSPPANTVLCDDLKLWKRIS